MKSSRSLRHIRAVHERLQRAGSKISSDDKARHSEIFKLYILRDGHSWGKCGDELIYEARVKASGNELTNHPIFHYGSLNTLNSLLQTGSTDVSVPFQVPRQALSPYPSERWGSESEFIYESRNGTGQGRAVCICCSLSSGDCMYTDSRQYSRPARISRRKWLLEMLVFSQKIALIAIHRY